MKKNVLKLTGFLLISTLLIGASRPSIEGRASVASEGDLPAGMYIKAHTFLPGDTVVITNPSTRVSVEVFVFETIDEGVAAIVSQDVADKLFIKNNADTIVQIQKVVAPTDIVDTGLFVEKQPDIAEPLVVEDFVDDSEIYIAENTSVESEVEEYSAINPFEDEPAVELVDDSTENVTDVIIATETFTDEEMDENALVFTPFSDMTSLFATEAATNEEYDVIEEEIEVAAFDDEIIEESVQEEVITEAVLIEEITEEIVVAEEEIEEETIVEPVVEELVQEELIEETLAIEESPIEDEIEVSIFDEPIIEEVVEEVAVVDEPLNEEIVEKEITLVIETPNVLSPTEENPPENIGIEEEPEVTFNADFSLEVIEDPVAEEEIDIFALTPATEYVDEIQNFTGNMRDFVVEEISVQGERKFYIQLATYKDSKNIDLVLSTYSQKYPLALLQSPVVRDAYQVVVGPLTKDEYTVVLERFKSYGYKDAFLRIAQ